LRHRHARIFIALAAAAAFSGGLALPASHAFADGTGPTLTADKLTNLDQGTTIHVTLSGAASDAGHQVQFAECDETYAAGQHGTYSTACAADQSNPVNVGNDGTATSTLTATYGVLNSAGASSSPPTCTDTSPDQCDLVAFDNSSSRQKIAASDPISFEAPPPPPPATTLTASPSTGLTDGETVQVQVSNVPAGAGELEIAECSTPASATPSTATCKDLIDGTATSGSYSTPVHVKYGNIIGSNVCDENTPSGDCTITALSDEDDSVIASAPISFAAPQIALSVSPATGLKDEQSVAVVATGIVSDDSPVDILECNTTYTAAHGGYGASHPGCIALDDQSLSENGGAVGAYEDVTDGALTGNGAVCDYATNGDCAIVITHYQGDTGTYVPVVTKAISFRPPVTGPATIVASPTTGLHAGAITTLHLTSADIADGVSEVEIGECSPAVVAKRGYDKGCMDLDRKPVVNNTIPAQRLDIEEGVLITPPGDEITCDHTHPCAFVLLNASYASSLVPVSNRIGISFRNPDVGTPGLSLSDSRGLHSHQAVKVTVTNVPDAELPIILFECNAKAAKGRYDDDAPCVQLSDKPLTVTDNTGRQTIKVHLGEIEDDRSSSGKAFCTAKTNGQCVIVAIANVGRHQKLLAKSAAITFAKN
jgi:hypothetical protein